VPTVLSSCRNGTCSTRIRDAAKDDARSLYQVSFERGIWGTDLGLHQQTSHMATSIYRSICMRIPGRSWRQAALTASLWRRHLSPRLCHFHLLHIFMYGHITSTQSWPIYLCTYVDRRWGFPGARLSFRRRPYYNQLHSVGEVYSAT
jgi:hypothetical protein